MDLATTTDRKGLKILPVSNLSVPLPLLSTHSRTESLLPSMQSSINFMYIFPYGLYPVLMKDSAGMQFLPELSELNRATPHQNSSHAQDLWFLLEQGHQKGKGEEWEGIYSSNKTFREKGLQSKPTQISVFPEVPMPGDPSGADGSLQTLHFRAVLHSYCLFPS